AGAVRDGSLAPREPVSVSEVSEVDVRSAVDHSRSAIQQADRIGSVPRQQILQRLPGLVVEALIEHRRLADAIEPEVPEIAAQLAPRRERPRSSPEKEAEWTHGPLRPGAARARVRQLQLATCDERFARDDEGVGRSTAADRRR